MTTTADSTLIDDAVIDGLRPQARRYDVAVSDELVLAVLPNGAKTWTWVYDGPGQPHRQTLGVYPEMSLKQARHALGAAAHAHGERGVSSTEYVIRDGRIQPSTRTVNWKWPLAGALVMLGAGVLLGWLLLGSRTTPPAAGNPVVTAPELPAKTMTLDTRVDVERRPPAAPPVTAASVEAPALAPPAQDPVENTAADPAPAEAPSEPAPGADTRVARAQITTAVVGREPVDALGPVLTGTGEDIQTYFFFTELRSLAGQRVRHRWIAGDRVEGEIPFEIGQAWRWRVYSSKRLLASMAGPWRVQVVTDDGTVIYDYPFEFQP